MLPMLRPTLAVSLYLAGKNVILVTGDAVAADRADRLEHAGANVSSLSADEAMRASLDQVFALFAHSGDPEKDRLLARRARAAGILAYAHDQPDESDFAMPALVRRGALSLAISTDAAAPALSRRLREELGRLVDDGGAAIDRLITELAARRAALDKGKRGGLYALAKRLRIDGRIAIEE